MFCREGWAFIVVILFAAYVVHKLAIACSLVSLEKMCEKITRIVMLLAELINQVPDVLVEFSDVRINGLHLCVQCSKLHPDV